LNFQTHYPLNRPLWKDEPLKALFRGSGLGFQLVNTSLAMSSIKIYARLLPLAASLFLTACGTTSGGYGAPRVVSGDKPLQCVPFVREQTGVNIYGDAHTWWTKAAGRYVRDNEPEEGAVLVLKGYRRNDRGHVAVVKHIVGDREIIIDHANWLNDGRIYLDQPVKDVSEDNDWSAVKVWYAPGEQYGARTYEVQGFIMTGRTYAEAPGS
jgi:surface antigen